MKMPEEKVRVQSVTIRQLQSVEKVEHDRMFKLIGILEYVSTQQSSWLFQLGDSTGQVDMVKDVIVSRRIESQEERIRRKWTNSWRLFRRYRNPNMITESTIEYLGTTTRKENCSRSHPSNWWKILTKLQHIV